MRPRARARALKLIAPPDISLAEAAEIAEALAWADALARRANPETVARLEALLAEMEQRDGPFSVLPPPG
jgi:hypothetical protein